MNRRTAAVALIAGIAAICFGRPDHLWIWLGVVCAVGAAAVLLGWLTFPRKKMAFAVERGEFRLLPRQNYIERFLNWGIPLLAGVVAGVVILRHAIAQRQSLAPEDQVLFFLVCTCAIALQVIFVWIAWSARWHTQPRVILSTDQPTLDSPFTLRVEFRSKKPVQIHDCQARLRCFVYQLLHYGRYTQLAIRPHTEHVAKLAEKIMLSPKELFAASADILLDSATHPATGKQSILSYPHFGWQLWIEISGTKKSTTIYPLFVAGKVTDPD
jgi:hypothetical protein